MGRPRARLSLKGRALQLLAQRDQSRLELRAKAAAPRRGRGPRPGRRRRGRRAGDGEGDAGDEADRRRAEVEALLDWLEANRFLSRRALCRIARPCPRGSLRQPAHPRRAGAARRRPLARGRPGARRVGAAARRRGARAPLPGAAERRRRAGRAGALSRRPRLFARGDPARPAALTSGAHPGRQPAIAAILHRRRGNGARAANRRKTRATFSAVLSGSSGRLPAPAPLTCEPTPDEDSRVPGQGNPCPLRHPRAARLSGLQRPRGVGGGAKARRLGLGRQGPDPRRRPRQGRRRQGGAGRPPTSPAWPARSSACSSRPSRPGPRARRCGAC